MKRGHFSFHLSFENTQQGRGDVCLSVCVSILEEAVSESLELRWGALNKRGSRELTGKNLGRGQETDSKGPWNGEELAI